MAWKTYIRARGLVWLITVVWDYVAFVCWVDYLKSGCVYDGREAITYCGTSAGGVLIGASLIAVVCTYHLLRSIIMDLNRHRDRRQAEE